MGKHRFIAGRLSLLALAVATGAPAMAQQIPDQGKAPDQGNGEIVVTAQRRAESRQDVGIAIAAFSGTELKKLNVASSLEIARLTPGVHLSGNVGGQNSQFTIRGVTQNDFNDAIEAPVAVYVDDGYIPNMQGQTFGMFDLERVEVLKGPQGTMFGRNATGGLVHYVVNKPKDKLEATFDATYGRFNQVKLESAINLPINDKVALRLSGYFDRYDPIYKNIYPSGAAGGVPLNLGGTTTPCCQNEGNDNTLAGRLQLQLKPTERLTVRIVGAAARQHLSSGQYGQVATVPVVDGQGRVVNAIFASPTETRTAIGPDGSNYTGLSGSPASRLPGADWFGFVAPNTGRDLVVSKDFAFSDINRTESYNAALHLDWDLDWAKVVSVSDYKKFDKNFVMDVDASPTSLVEYGTKAKTDSFSQELRIAGSSDKLTWSAGVYYLHINARSSNGFMAPAGSLFAGSFGAATTGIDLVNSFRLITDSGSIFGQVEYAFAPRWKVIVGGRLIREHQNYTFASNAMADTDPLRLDTGTPLFTLQPSYANSRANTLWAGKAQIEFRPVHGLLLYFGVNRGVKGGSYNAKLPDGTTPLTASEIPYQPEVLLSYEGGFKSTFWGGKATFDASGFYYDYSNYQAFTFANVSGFVQNRTARTYGIEAELTLRPVRGLQLGLSGSAFNARVKDLQIAPGVYRDVRPAFAPETQLAARVSYRLPYEVAGGAVTFGADGSFTSGFFHNLRNFDANWVRKYALLNARIGWEDDAQRLRLSFFVNNVTNKSYVSTGYDLSTLCGCTEVAYGKPRWWGISAGFSFQ